MTGKEICEAYARHLMPSATDAEIAERALALWGASNDGSLHHVAAMREELIGHGALPDDEIPEHPNVGDMVTRRTVSGIERLLFDGSSWQ